MPIETPISAWIGSEHIGIPLVIAGLRRTDKEKELTLLTPSKQVVKMTLSAANWNFLVFHDAESDNWIGKTIILKSEDYIDRKGIQGKTRKIVSVK